MGYRQWMLSEWLDCERAIQETSIQSQNLLKLKYKNNFFGWCDMLALSVSQAPTGSPCRNPCADQSAAARFLMFRL